MIIVGQQIRKRIRKTLDLKNPTAVHGTQGTNDRIARADEDRWIHVDRPRPVFQLPGETVMHAAETRLPGIAEIEIGKKPPDPDRHISDVFLLDLAEPSDQSSDQPPRDPVSKQEVQILLMYNLH
jgi:hypothetical protein